MVQDCPREAHCIARKHDRIGLQKEGQTGSILKSATSTISGSVNGLLEWRTTILTARATAQHSTADIEQGR